jgi:hypothetical protein
MVALETAGKAASGSRETSGWPAGGTYQPATPPSQRRVGLGRAIISTGRSSLSMAWRRITTRLSSRRQSDRIRNICQSDRRAPRRVPLGMTSSSAQGRVAKVGLILAPPSGPLLGRSSFAGIDQALQRYLAWRRSRPEYDNVVVALHFVADRYRSDRTIGIANHPYRRDLAPLRSQLSFKISGR